ncbi:hypothetical protein [Marinomonas transparens]|uniref:Uncharacterized protein n=1 Tax=Marinomonas transparens TaxID=2795388 RepID=A0A934N6M8_9GAMM|nr:hypothetical protein [Marinomonas transparens]MBJ7538196.1 hypothetical protein [Marinomonas transparens]
MAKWLIWTLLEFSTFMLIASAFLLWLSNPLKKQLKQQAPRSQNTQSPPLSEEQIAGAEDYKHLVHYLDQQIEFAANSIMATGHLKPASPAHINRFKLWGTILKAERAILLNEVSDHPKPILNRFLSSLLFAVQPSRLKERKIEDLDKTLKDTSAEFFLMGERLVTKETLSQSQFMLNEDLRKNIRRAEKRLEQLQMKKKEQQKLQLEIIKLQSQIKLLVEQQGKQNGTLKPFDLQTPKIIANEKDRLQHPTLKQIATLNNLSKRQTMVIEQLKNELDRAHKNNRHAEVAEMKRVALSKMERMCEESQSLTLQLEEELKASSQTIASLNEDLAAKEARLIEIETQLANKNETATSTLQTLNASKKETLVSLRDGLDTALEQGKSENLLEQDKDVKMLERLLQESETCVTLLVQELEIAEGKNEQLKQEIEATKDSRHNSKTSSHQPLIEQREKNRKLVQAVTELKEKVLEQAANADLQKLKVTFNKKSLEYDRLQVSYTDLEIKYLETLKNS